MTDETESTQHNFSKEFREQAVNQVTEEWLSQTEAARRLSMPVSTLEYWLKAAQIGKLGDVGKTQRPLTEIELELAKTKRTLAEIKMERDLIKKTAAYLPGKCGEVRDDEGITGGITRCRLCAVSTKFRGAGITLGLGVHHRNGHRMRGDWKWKSEPPTSAHSIKRIRRELRIRCKQKRKFKATINSDHAMPVAPNLLEQKSKATVSNQIWVTDINYIPANEGWLYLVGHKDLFSGHLVGYAMSEHNQKLG